MLTARFTGALEGYAGSRFSGKEGHFRLFFGKDPERTYHTRGLDRNEDSRVEEASVVLYSLSHGEGFGGLDYTMGGHGAQRTDGGDVGADTGEAGDGTGDRYGTSPGTRKGTGLAG